MPTNSTIYFGHKNFLSRNQLSAFDKTCTVQTHKHPVKKTVSTIQVSWPGISLQLNPMGASKVPQHVQGFQGYVRQILGGADPNETTAIFVERVDGVQQVLGCVFDPPGDATAFSFIVRLAETLDGLLFMEDGSLVIARSRLTLRPNGSTEMETF
jgi:hypothetical protein